MADELATLADRLKFVRGLSGLPIRELAKLAGISPSHPWQIESGRVENVGSEALVGICRVLGCSMDWLVMGTGEPPTEEQVQAAVAAVRAEQPAVVNGDAG